MLKMTHDEVIKMIDEMNKEKFEYIGVLYHISGDRYLVERTRDFFANLKAEPIKEIEVATTIDPRLNNKFKAFVIINVGEVRYNIYRLEDIKLKRLKDLCSKEKCMVRLEVEG
jgi:hypothetical protein